MRFTRENPFENVAFSYLLRVYIYIYKNGVYGLFYS